MCVLGLHQKSLRKWIKEKILKKHYRKIEEFIQNRGVVRMMSLTEKQYTNIFMGTGEDYLLKINIGKNCLIML